MGEPIVGRLVESYGAESDVADQCHPAELAGELGTSVSYVRTTIVPGDQSLLHTFEPTSTEALRAAIAAAALECDRIVEVVEALARPE